MCVWLFAVRLASVFWLNLQRIGCTTALACDVQRYCSCSCRLWRYISVMPLPFTFYSMHASSAAVDLLEQNF